MKVDAVIFLKATTINGSGTNIDAKKNNGYRGRQRHSPYHRWNRGITAVGDAFNVNDELNITGMTMTIDADEDVKVDTKILVGTMYLQITK